MLFLCLATIVGSGADASTGDPPPATDYCAMLGVDDIQGKKSGEMRTNSSSCLDAGAL